MVQKIYFNLFSLIVILFTFRLPASRLTSRLQNVPLAHLTPSITMRYKYLSIWKCILLLLWRILVQHMSIDYIQFYEITKIRLATGIVGFAKKLEEHSQSTPIRRYRLWCPILTYIGRQDKNYQPSPQKNINLVRISPGWSKKQGTIQLIYKLCFD